MDEETREYLTELERRIDLQFRLLNDAVDQRDRFLHGQMFTAVGWGLGALGAWLIGKALDWLGFHDSWWGAVLFWIIVAATTPVVARFLTKAHQENESRLSQLPKWPTQVPRRPRTEWI